MKILGIAGHSGMGRTTLLERLVPDITLRGLTVSLIKHSHKNIDIDRPGTPDPAGRSVQQLALAEPAAIADLVLQRASER